MFLLPKNYVFDIKNPPRLTLAMLAVLTLIFLAWPRLDIDRQVSLDQQYINELMKIEWPLYETHLLKTRQSSLLTELQESYAREEYEPIAQQLGADKAFVQSLHTNGADYLDSEVYSNWQQSRNAYDSEHKKLSSSAIGLNAQDFRPITFITHQLLENSWTTLLGHVILLVTAGLVIEVLFGGMALLVLMLGGGLLGGITFLLLNSNSVIPYIGAGASISAVVSAFLYRLRNEKLYLLGKTPITPWLIAGIWCAVIAAEFLFVNASWQRLLPQIIALLAGPFLLIAYERWLKPSDVVVVEVEEVDNDLVYREQLNKTLQVIGNMQFEEAKKQLRELVKAYPRDLRVLEQLYKVEKLSPQSDTFEAVARRLFNLSNTDEAAQICLNIYRDYSKLTHDSRALDMDTTLKLVLRFARLGEVKEAEKLMRSAIDKKISHALLPKAAHSLAVAFEKLQDSSRANYYREFIKS